MFDDTEHPVCLAFFVEDKTQLNLSEDDFYIFKDEQYIRYNTLMERYKDLFDMDCNLEIKMNAPEGEFGFRCIDNNIKNDIRMTKGEEITSTIKHSSRSVTRFDILGAKIDNKDKFIDEVNEFIESFRYETHDIFLTAFKGLKRDGNYRMRISFSLIKKIINFVYEELYEK